MRIDQYKCVYMKKNKKNANDKYDCDYISFAKSKDEEKKMRRKIMFDFDYSLTITCM